MKTYHNTKGKESLQMLVPSPELFFDGTMWRAMHAALLGGSGGMPPQKNFGKLPAWRLILVGFGR